MPEPGDLPARVAVKPQDAAGLDIGGENAAMTRTSPAKSLQDALTTAMTVSEPQKWSARKTVAFIVVGSGAFWLLVGAAIIRLAR